MSKFEDFSRHLHFWKQEYFSFWLNFDFLENGLGIVSVQHFVYETKLFAIEVHLKYIKHIEYKQITYHIICFYSVCFIYFKYFLYDFLRKMFLMLYSINWPNIIPSLIAFTFWNIGKYVHCNCLFTSLWRNKFWNLQYWN